MSGTEPNGWELKRSIDQVRDDNKEDFAEVKAGNKALSDKIDNLGTIYVTRTEHGALTARVTTIETERKAEATARAQQRIEDNRARRANNIALAGLLLTALVFLITTILQLTGK